MQPSSSPEGTFKYVHLCGLLEGSRTFSDIFSLKALNQNSNHPFCPFLPYVLGEYSKNRFLSTFFRASLNSYSYYVNIHPN